MNSESEKKFSKLMKSVYKILDLIVSDSESSFDVNQLPTKNAKINKYAQLRMKKKRDIKAEAKFMKSLDGSIRIAVELVQKEA